MKLKPQQSESKGRDVSDDEPLVNLDGNATTDVTDIDIGNEYQNPNSSSTKEGNDSPGPNLSITSNVVATIGEETSHEVEKKHAELHESLVSGMLTFDTSLCRNVIHSATILNSKSLTMVNNKESSDIDPIPPTPSVHSAFSFSTVSLRSDELSANDFESHQNHTSYGNVNQSSSNWHLLSNWSMGTGQHSALSTQSSSLSFRTSSLREDELSSIDEIRHNISLRNHGHHFHYESSLSLSSSNPSHPNNQPASLAPSVNRSLSFYTASLREDDISSMGSRQFQFDSGYVTKELYQEGISNDGSYSTVSIGSLRSLHSDSYSQNVSSVSQRNSIDSVDLNELELSLESRNEASNLSSADQSTMIENNVEQPEHRIRSGGEWRSSGEEMKTIFGSNVFSSRDETPVMSQSTSTGSTPMSDIEQVVIDNQQEEIAAPSAFIRDTSYWFKPEYTREQTIAILRDKATGSFIVQQNRGFPGDFGLALKVDNLPPNVQAKPGADLANEYVRHFLIEPRSRGVKLKGCPNEPVFGSLSALVYQHSITPIALPCKLLIPTVDQEIPQRGNTPRNSQEKTPPTTPSPATTPSDLLKQGAACNVIYIGSVNTESLTGPSAIERAIRETYESARANPSRTSVVHFKVSRQGITLTDNARKLFFRRHYPTQTVTFCGLDPQGSANKGQSMRRWDATKLRGSHEAWLFGFVARTQAGSRDNTCHVFAELDPAQPGRAIVNFVMRVLIGSNRQNSN